MKKYFLGLLACMYLNASLAQLFSAGSKLIEVQVPKATEAVAFQRFGDIPVDYSTGTPDISFSLYKIVQGGINVPISLSYHASGIKVNDVAGCVGLGFRLNAGGRINRTILDKDDLGSYQPLNFSTPAAYEAARDQVYQTSTSAGDIKFSDLATKLWEDRTYADRISDRYTLFLPNGKSVVFRKNFSSGVFEQIPFENLKIEMINQNFKITDADGTIYYYNLFDSDGWNLTRIESPNTNAFLDFTYGASILNSFITPPLIAEESGPVAEALMTQGQSGQTCFDVVVGPGETNAYQGYFGSAQTGGFYNNLVTKISNDEIEVTFVYNNGRNDPADRKLTEVTVLEKFSNTLVKRVAFSYSNFGSSANNNWRLKLNSFRFLPIGDNSGQRDQIYSFSYYEDVTLPSYFDINNHRYYHEDLFGYYNGTSSLSNIPTELAVNTTNSSDRYPNPIYTKACSLKEVTYPTGGKTEFELENNYGMPYSAPFITGNPNNLGYGGGLRIKSIKDYTSVGTLSGVKTFEYEGGGFKTIGSETFSYQNRIVLTLDPFYMGYDLNRTLTLAEAYDQLSVGANPSIIYSNVKEYQGTSANNTGYNEYLYAMPVRQEQNAYEFPSIHMKHAWQWDYGNEYPLLSAKYVYKKETPVSYALLSEELYEYTPFKQRKFTTGINVTEATVYVGSSFYNYWPELAGTITYAPTSQSTSFCLHLGPDPNAMAPSANLFFSANNIFATETSGYIASHLLTKKTQTYLSNGAYLTTEKTFEYDPATILLQKEKVKNSKGQELVRELKYPTDYPLTLPYSNMVANNIIVPLIQETKTNYTENSELSKTKTNFLAWQGGVRYWPSSTESSILGNSLETEISINNYDSKGNILQTTSKDGIITSYIWGYNQQYLVGKVVNKAYTDAISESNLNLSIINSPLSDASLRTELNKLRALANVFVTTYTYKPLVGLTSETDPRGRTIYHEYDEFNRLSIIRDHDNKVIKKICYNYAGQPENCAAPCTNATADWQNMSAPVCQLQTGTDVNTGYVLQQQKDVNPCSSTYNQTQTVTIYNPTLCPPPACGQGNCSGNDKKCINGVCETGVWSVVSSVYISKNNWQCTWAYCFSDGSTSAYTQTVTNTTACTITCI